MSEAWERLGRFVGAVRDSARTTRDRARELRDEFRTSDEPDTHLHLLRMGLRPPEGRPDRRRPRLLWSVARSRAARIDSEHGSTRLVRFPSTIVFDDGSWIRIVNPAPRGDQARFLAAVRELPGRRPTL
ncbi:hypothetical protein [Plantactinospora sp. B5E13]|uniref:hypothetical protein n=1 Tax=unclassified Plantactinospora TaxID=2631981 RepID=UPI00325F87F3